MKEKNRRNLMEPKKWLSTLIFQEILETKVENDFILQKVFLGKKLSIFSKNIFEIRLI